ncbi:DUF1330 domain-containing protein [Salmonella enterica]|nr:DUF1330 domain-containing protein [Salmonella enterica subsp. enterica serovar Minnesota]EHU7139092.1 DUF1330 domain-containing protein [Salmonella enterica]EIE6435431.1 DUF1330 domain-containing protein [Salmonella enterica]EIG1430356.1 DUF1330 domain-containing protein [Salmonella enterica]EIG1435941.1 DUF1330 domain-containing protein [Salmonella enterica]
MQPPPVHLMLPGPARHVRIEFSGMESVLACYHSPKYQLTRDTRKSVAEAMITIVMGGDIVPLKREDRCSPGI